MSEKTSKNQRLTIGVYDVAPMQLLLDTALKLSIVKMFFHVKAMNHLDQILFQEAYDDK